MDIDFLLNAFDACEELINELTEETTYMRNEIFSEWIDPARRILSEAQQKDATDTKFKQCKWCGTKFSDRESNSEYCRDCR